MKRLVVGTRNAKKLCEIVDLLGDLEIELTDLTSWPDAPTIEETAGSFIGNATLKAVTLANFLHEWVLGEDSGLCVPALGGEPGVDSALYAGVHGDDAANNAKLLERMRHLSGEDRNAYYVSTAVLADPLGRVVAQVEGHCDGCIIDQPRGQSGFGYDPLFLIPDLGRTFGELPAEVKRARSHRAKALNQLRELLIGLKSKASVNTSGIG